MLPSFRLLFSNRIAASQWLISQTHPSDEDFWFHDVWKQRQYCRWWCIWQQKVANLTQKKKRKKKAFAGIQHRKKNVHEWYFIWYFVICVPVSRRTWNHPQHFTLKARYHSLAKKHAYTNGKHTTHPCKHNTTNGKQLPYAKAKGSTNPNTTQKTPQKRSTASAPNAKLIAKNQALTRKSKLKTHTQSIAMHTPYTETKTEIDREWATQNTIQATSKRPGQPTRTCGKASATVSQPTTPQSKPPKPNKPLIVKHLRAKAPKTLNKKYNNKHTHTAIRHKMSERKQKKGCGQGWRKEHTRSGLNTHWPKGNWQLSKEHTRSEEQAQLRTEPNHMFICATSL